MKVNQAAAVTLAKLALVQYLHTTNSVGVQYLHYYKFSRWIITRQLFLPLWQASNQTGQPPHFP
jgi:hypothetical protein